MSRFTLARGVPDDLREIWRYIVEQSQDPDMADREIDRIIDAFNLLSREPLLGELRKDLAPGVRCFVVGSYLVLYAPQKDGTRIIQVVHAARDIRTAFRPQ